MGKTTKKLDPQAQADIDYLSTLVAKATSGIVASFVSDGPKVIAALSRLTKDEANDELLAPIWAKFWLISPKASSMIEALSALSPTMKATFERLRMKAKDVPPEDVQVRDGEPPVKDAEPC